MCGRFLVHTESLNVVSTFTRGSTQPELARRVVGFCSGLVDAVGGHLHVIGENVVLLAPDPVELPRLRATVSRRGGSSTRCSAAATACRRFDDR
jgi:hypothetical protein